MDLSKIKPQKSTFTLTHAPGRIFTMNPINLGDEIWLDQVYGDTIGDVFENLNIKEISRIVFRLLRPEDKAFFKKQTITLVNEEGEEGDVEMGGVAMLQSLISGWDEKIQILNALMKNIGLSRPEVSEDDKEDDKSPKKKQKN